MIRWLLVVLPIIAVTGCGPVPSYYMKRQQVAQRVETSSETATVVFLRPTGGLAGLEAPVLDAAGALLGTNCVKSYFALQVPPGEHTFHMIDGAAALKATVAAGRIYFVEVSPIGWMGIFIYRLFALTPSSKNWDKLPEWLAGSALLTRDEAALATLANSYRTNNLDVSGEIQKSLARHAAFDAENRALRTLRADDGVEKWPLAEGAP
jgi:hypothetical protein